MVLLNIPKNLLKPYGFPFITYIRWRVALTTIHSKKLVSLLTQASARWRCARRRSSATISRPRSRSSTKRRRRNWAWSNPARASLFRRSSSPNTACLWSRSWQSKFDDALAVFKQTQACEWEAGAPSEFRSRGGRVGSTTKRFQSIHLACVYSFSNFFRSNECQRAEVSWEASSDTSGFHCESFIRCPPASDNAEPVFINVEVEDEMLKAGTGAYATWRELRAGRVWCVEPMLAPFFPFRVRQAQRGMLCCYWLKVNLFGGFKRMRFCDAQGEWEEAVSYPALLDFSFGSRFRTDVRKSTIVRLHVSAGG